MLWNAKLASNAAFAAASKRLFRNENENDEMHLGNITIIKSKRQILVDSQEIIFTQREYELLLYLIKNKGKVCSRNQIIEDVWDIHFEYDTGVIDVFINAIRKKLNLNKEEELIKTIRGVGYIANDLNWYHVFIFF